MHTALQLSEILAAILEHCSSGTLGTAAAVCRTWEMTANSMLWRNVTTLWTLLQVLGPMEEGDRGMTFARPFSEMNWDRFLHHAQRIRELSYDFDIKGQRAISPEALIMLATTRPKMCLMPCLDRLVWAVVDHDHFSFARLFMHSELTSLHLIVFAGMRTAVLRDFLHGLPNVCARLTELELDCGTSSSSLEPVLTDTIKALPDMEYLCLPAYGITTSVLRALSHHKFLKRLGARPFWRSSFVGDPDDVKSIDVSGLPENAFSKLVELDLDSRFNVLRNVLSSPCVSRSITHLNVSAFEREPLSALTSFLDLVSKEFSSLTDLMVAYLVKPPDPDQDEPIPDFNLPRISLDVIRPALRLGRLHCFHLKHNRPLVLSESDIEELGRAWGGPTGTLRTLHLVPDPVWTTLSTDDGPPALGLFSLEKFASALPLLEWLEIYIDAEHGVTSRPPPPVHKFENLTTLGFGISPISHTAIGPIARWLAKLAPCTDLSITYGADWTLGWAELGFSVELDHIPRRDAWQRVEEMHSQLVLYAAETRREIERDLTLQKMVL